MKKLIAVLVGTMALGTVACSTPKKAPVTLEYDADVITVTAKAPTRTAIYFEAEPIVVTAKRPAPESRVALYWEAPTITVTAKRPAPLRFVWNAPTITVTAKKAIPVRFAVRTEKDVPRP